MSRRISICRWAQCVAALALAGNASAADEFNFASPSANPQGTAIRPGATVTVQVCAKRSWLDSLVGAGALWPGPPYKVNLTWEAKKWTWAPPPKLATATSLVTPIGQKICSAPLAVAHADFPIEDLWRVRATLQYDKGFKSGPIERFIRILPPLLKKSTGKETVMPVQPSTPTRTPRRN
jgi:hypothetical protein